MFRVFVKVKPCSIMTTLKDQNSTWYLSKLALATGTTYVYVTKLVYSLAKEGYLQVEPKGKKRMVRLTEKGIIVANAISDLNSRMSPK
jgi:predicted transcriptional regulator